MVEKRRRKSVAIFMNQKPRCMRAPNLVVPMVHSLDHKVPMDAENETGRLGATAAAAAIAGDRERKAQEGKGKGSRDTSPGRAAAHNRKAKKRQSVKEKR